VPAARGMVQSFYRMEAPGPFKGARRKIRVSKGVKGRAGH